MSKESEALADEIWKYVGAAASVGDKSKTEIWLHRTVLEFEETTRNNERDSTVDSCIESLANHVQENEDLGNHQLDTVLGLLEAERSSELC